MKNNHIIVIVISVIAILLSGYSLYLNLTAKRFGYVDTAVLMQEFSGAIDARKKLESETKEWDENIKTLETELGELNQKLIEESPKTSKTKIATMQEDIKKKQYELYKYRNAVEEKASMKEQELFAPVYDNLNALIKEFGEEHGYYLIFGTIAGGNILHASPESDLTQDLLEFIKQKTGQPLE